MERDGTRRFDALKAELEEAVREAEAGGSRRSTPPNTNPPPG